MVRIFDPDSHADIPHRVTINLDRDDTDYPLGNALQQNFLTSINHARTLCSGDEHGPGGLSYTIDDPVRPLLLVTMIAHNDAQINFGTDLILDRKTCYVQGLIAGGRWRVPKAEAENPYPYGIRGAETLPFGVSYQEAGGITKFSRVGGSTLLNALHTLHAADQTEWKSDYFTLCVHIAESIRFHRIASVISRGLGGPTRYNSLTLTDQDQGLITSWSSISKHNKRGGWSPLMTCKTGISKLQDAPQHVALLPRQTT